MPLKLYIYFILCMLIYLVFNNLTIIFQVPRLLLWDFLAFPPPQSPTIWLSITVFCHTSEVSLWPICSKLSSVHISEDLPWSGHHGGSLDGQGIGLTLSDPLCELDCSLA